MKAVKEIVRKYYKYYDYSDTFNFVQNGTRTNSGWQSVSTDVNYLSGSSNAYQMGQRAQNSLVYTYNDTIPATTYTFNLTISGQGNGYDNNPTVTVTYEDGTQEVVYTKSFSGSSLNEDFTFTAIAPINKIALTSFLTHSSTQYVGIGVTLTSKSYIVQVAEESTEQDYDFYKDIPIYKIVKENDIYKAPRSWEKGQYYGN